MLVCSFIPLSKIREEGWWFFWAAGEQNQNPTKIQEARELSSGHESTLSLLEVGISGEISACLQQLPCPSRPLFLFLCCLNTRKKIRDCGPQRASLLLATKVNDLIPCDFSHLLQHYACVIPAISSQIKMQSCLIAGALGGKVRGCDPRGDSQTIALLEGTGGKGIAAPRHGQIQEPCVMSPWENRLCTTRRSPEMAISDFGWFKIFPLMLRARWTSLGSRADLVGY